MLVFVIFDLVLSCNVTVVFPVCRCERNNLNERLDPFPSLGWLLNKKVAELRLIYRWLSFTG